LVVSVFQLAQYYDGAVPNETLLFVKLKRLIYKARILWCLTDNEKTSCFVFRASALTLKPLISGLSGHGFGVRIRSSQCDNNLLLTAAISLISDNKI
jgi:hypothetical protein